MRKLTGPLGKTRQIQAAPVMISGVYNSACPKCERRWMAKHRAIPISMLDVEIEIEDCPRCAGTINLRSISWRERAKLNQKGD